MKCPKCQTGNPDTQKYCGECGTQLTSLDEISVSPTKTLETRVALIRGSVLANRYEIIEELGRGGMGKVYKVHDIEIKEDVALKLLKPEIADDAKMIERFRNEMKYARKIVHKNVGRMYDIGKEGRSYYITMEYVPGEDLKSFIRRSGQLTVAKSLFIAKQICEGLAEAHKSGIVHRDLKSRNIMIDKEGNSRIMDFGIARSLNDKGITGTGVIIGTPEYMSPEQVEGRDLDSRSDIYSLGIILYEMVTGHVPFEGETAFSVAMKHKSEVPKNPKEINDQLPDDLCLIILKCLEKNRANRFQKVSDLFEEMSRIEEGLPTTDRVIVRRKPFTLREITVKFIVKKLLTPALAFIAVAILGIVIWQLIIRSQSPETMPLKPVSSKAENYFLEGKKSWENKDYSEAIVNFKRALVENSNHVEAQLSIAGILREQGKLDEAAREYEKAITIDDSDSRSFKPLGEIFEQKQEFDKAILYYQKFLQTTSDKPHYDEVERTIRDLEARLQPKQIKERPSIEPDKLAEKRREKPKAVPDVKTSASEKTPSRKTVSQPTVPEKKEEKFDVSSKLNSAIEAFELKNYEQCIKQMEEILKFDPQNAEAKEYRDLSRREIAIIQIRNVINEYESALSSNNLSSFYEETCTPEYYQRIKKDAELISRSYEEFHSSVSDINIQCENHDKVKASFSQIITGITEKSGAKQVLFEGIFNWDMKKEGDAWRIVTITFRPTEKRQNHHL